MALPIPVNSTILYLNDWRNGSLFPQFQNSSVFSEAAVYNSNNQDQGLKLTILANNVALLTLNASGFNHTTDGFYSATISGTLALAETLFDPNAARFPVTCQYPISGQYDTLSRALFYILMIFSLVFRRHIWISVAALGTAMVYAATSAIHSFVLAAFAVKSSQRYSDIDLIGILPILAASAIMVTPILFWSTTIREQDAQSIVAWWGILIFSALACLMYNLFGLGVNLDQLQSFAICNQGCISESDYFTFKLYQDCNCMDFCGTLGPPAPMRKGANMGPTFGHKISGKVVNSNSFNELYKINTVALVFIAIYGVMGLLVSRHWPDEVRNGIFWFWDSDLPLTRRFAMVFEVIFENDREPRAPVDHFYAEEKHTPRTTWKKCKYVFAKSMAILFSLTAGATAIICPAVFISTVITNEFIIQDEPLSEYSDAIGAWGTWVGAAMVLIAAVINRYGGSWLRIWKFGFRSAWRMIVYSKDERARLQRKDKSKSISTGMHDLGPALASPLVHAWWSLARGLWTLKTTVIFSLEWWKDPGGKSRMRRADIKKTWEDTEWKNKPKCRCYGCKDKKNRKMEKEDKGYKAFATSYEALHLKKMAFDADEMPLLRKLPLPPPRCAFTRQNTD